MLLFILENFNYKVCKNKTSFGHGWFEKSRSTTPKLLILGKSWGVKTFFIYFEAAAAAGGKV